MICQAVVYTKPNCPQCVETKTLLKQRGVDIQEKPVSSADDIGEMMEHIGMAVRTMPQVFINCGDKETYIGSLTEVKTFFSTQWQNPNQ